MASVTERKHKSAHFKFGGLALLVGIIEAVVMRFATPATGFSVAEFAFAFVLTYSIAFGVFSKDVHR